MLHQGDGGVAGVEEPPLLINYSFVSPVPEAPPKQPIERTEKIFYWKILSWVNRTTKDTERKEFIISLIWLMNN